MQNGSQEKYRQLQAAPIGKKFLEREKDRWTCSHCGGVISMHDGICCGCGKNYTDRKH